MKQIITILIFFCALFCNAQSLPFPSKNTSKNRILVTQQNAATTLGGTIDTLSEYFITEKINMSGIEIEVPIGGIYLRGYNFDISQLNNNSDNEVLFTSPVGGSGNILMFDLGIEMSGVNSKVYDLVSNTGFDAIEIVRVNYNNCSSLGEIDNYRQGLETGTGRFGGTPNLILSGAWNGFRISTSITRGLSDAWTGALFEAGTGFSMSGRFVTDMNLDLGTNSSFFDFAPSNFTNTNTLQLDGCIVTRDNISNVNDTNITPNITEENILCYWRNNQGIKNTTIVSKSNISTEITTTISTVGAFVNLNGTYTNTIQAHIDSPVNGQFRNLGENPTTFFLNGVIILDGSPNGEYTIRVRKYNSETTLTSTVNEITRQINNSVGGLDVADFPLISIFSLGKNDYIFFEVSNNTNTTNCRAKLGSTVLLTAL